MLTSLYTCHEFDIFETNTEAHLLELYRREYNMYTVYGDA